MEKHPLVKEILYTNDQISATTAKVAGEVDAYYKTQTVKDNTILVLGLLRGCVPFLAEFIKHLEIELETDYMVVSSYEGGLESTNNPKIILDVNTDLKGRHVLIIEDVIDSGMTLECIKDDLLQRGAQEVKIVTMINKTINRKKAIEADWSCFEVNEDTFLIGFGLDYQERLRNLPYVGTMDMDKLKDWKW